jgi:hypothetical protein
MSQSHHPYEVDNSGGSFLSGFTFGLFAGAAGYFLFGTERGAKVRRQLEEEWRAAQSKMFSEGVIDAPTISLRDMLKDFVHKVASSDHPLTDMVDQFTAQSAQRKPRARKSANKRFKNV